MATYKCKMCGANLTLSEGATVTQCEYCGSQQTVPAANDEKKMIQFSRANQLRLKCEFDKAAGIYESIVADFPEEPEAYWGLVLCKYGIEYVDDPKTHKRIPTCHRTSVENVTEDADYRKALEYADPVAKILYQEEAVQIEALCRSILEVSGKEEPFDIFICYKETDENGDRTLDSVIAQEVYDALTEKGYRVFFSRITLENKLGTQYEPYIFAALNSAEIMLAFGTDPDYFNAVWVKNEWSRFLQLIAKGENKTLIPCYKGIDPSEMPKEFARLQSQDLGKLGATQDLLRGIEKLLSKGKKETTTERVIVRESSPQSATVESLITRAFMFLEDGEWKDAKDYCNKVLDIDPKEARAYVGLLMADNEASKQDDLKNLDKPFDNNPNYKKAFRFADEELKKILQGYLQTINQRIERREEERKRREEERRKRFQKAKKFSSLIATATSHSVGLKSDGTVVATGWNAHSQCNVSNWRDIVAISADNSHTVGLKSDGTVVATGEDGDSQCDVSDWKNVIAVSTDPRHTVGLKSDGTVVATGWNAYDQCNVSDWKDIIAVSAGLYTVGLKSDGTVVATGDNNYGQCNVSDWRDIVAISKGISYTVGLKSDGTVVATGWNSYGQCNVSNWRDIVAISADDSHTVGLKSDGTVVATGWNAHDQCNVFDWKDIIAVSLGSNHTVGLKSDGTVVATGNNDDGRCNVSDWRDIVTISASDCYTVGLKSDGTVVATGNNDDGRCNVSDWKLFNSAETYDEETIAAKARRKKEDEEASLRQFRRRSGLCEYCGGTFKGLFTKKCSSCGRPKDY